MSVLVQSVPGVLDYFTPPADGSKPWIHINSDPKTGKRPQNWKHAQIEMTIQDVRNTKDEYNLDEAGFEFHTAPTELKADDFEDETKIREVYYKEQADLIKKLVGASQVMIFDHTIRRNFPGRFNDTPETRTPVSNVHVDQTPTATVNRIHRHMPAEQVPELLKHRYQIINLWRPIRVPAYDRPLALCDFRTVDVKRDCTAQTLVYPDREGETWAVRFYEGHKWKYLKGMTPDELVLIKCGDSITDGSVSLCTPHTSFVDPTAPKDAKPRESIELRALVFYDH